ncbi:MAG: ABC transporter ATP-binding protein [Betaproteobacteria bacterium]|nr:ABC transporter ATP-binding protein [Betaproteobacteria bacterium]
MNQLLLEIKSAYKNFPGKPVLNGVDFSVASGQIVGLLGRNGAGKTTLLECALGLREIEYGEIRVCGDPPNALSETTRARIGYVPQQTDLFEWLTAEQMLAYFKAFYPRWNDAKVGALMQRWSIPPNRMIGKLSGGEKQRLAIIRALAHDPDLLILDEPVAGLDPAGRREFLRELVERTIERETTVVFSTHILSDLERVAIDVAFMKDGQITLQRPLDQLSERVRRIVGPTDLLARLRFGHELARINDGASNARIVALCDDQDELQLQSLKTQGVSIEAVTLEDLFMEVA